MERWNVGIVEKWVLKAGKINSNMIKFLLTQYSNLPVFQYSNLGEAPKFNGFNVQSKSFFRTHSRSMRFFICRVPSRWVSSDTCPYCR